MQIWQRIFKHIAMKVLHFLDKICKLLTYHTPFTKCDCRRKVRLSHFYSLAAYAPVVN